MKFETEFQMMMHPKTYVNKLLFIGSNEDETKSTMQLWNIMSQEMLYDFKNVTDGRPPITCVE